MNTKHIYFVPFAQDNYEKKPNSMVAKMELLSGDDFGSFGRKAAAAGGTGIKKPPDRSVWGGFYIIPEWYYAFFCAS